MICPKCADLMQTYERNGVHIEQCHACKGIFLDHGELEQLAAAERRYYTDREAELSGSAAPQPEATYEPPPGRAPGRPGYPEPAHHDDYRRRRRSKRRRDFIEDIFDGLL